MAGHIIEEARSKRSIESSKIDQTEDSFSSITVLDGDELIPEGEALTLEKTYQTDKNLRTKETFDEMLKVIKSLEDKVAKLQDEVYELKGQNSN